MQKYPKITTTCKNIQNQQPPKGSTTSPFCLGDKKTKEISKKWSKNKFKKKLNDRAAVDVAAVTEAMPESDPVVEWSGQLTAQDGQANHRKHPDGHPCEPTAESRTTQSDEPGHT